METLTIYKKERKRPDPPDLASQKPYADQDFYNLSPYLMNHFADPIEAISISAH